MVATDLNGRIIYWNAFAEHLYGWTSQEVLDADIVETVPSLSSKDHAVLIMEQLREGQSWSGEMILQRRDGSQFLGAITDSPILNEKGKLIGVVGVSSDITEAKRAEEERARLLESERLARLELKMQTVSKTVSRHAVTRVTQSLNVVISLLRDPSARRHEE